MKWKPIPLYENLYEVSDSGEVKSIGSGPRRHTGRILSKKMAGPYNQIDLSRAGKKKRFGIHVLVALAFNGPKPTPRHEVNHKNGKKRDNRADNLEWVTRKENGKHASSNGLLRPPCLAGEKNGRAKLSRSQVNAIRAAKGIIGMRPLAKAYGVSKSTIQFIHQGKHWK